MPASDAPHADDEDLDAGHSAWTARRLALLALTALALYLCWLIARPFVASLAWASALAVAAWPLHRRLARPLRRPGLAALLTCTLVFILLGVPATMLVPRIVAESAGAYETLRSWIDSGGAQQLFDRQAWLRPAWEWTQGHLNTGALLQRAGDLAAGVGKSAVQASLDGLLQLTLTFFLLFYFLRDRDAVLRTLASLMPLSRAEARALLREVGDTLHATLVGKVLVSLLQGALGGLMFVVLGVPAALFWSVVMAIAALVPVLGTPVVWGPAALWLAFDGSWGKAAVLVAWGTAIVGMADNLIYPAMVGNRVRLHTVPMLLSMIGGLFVFGMAGFFVGPVVLAATLALLRIWTRRSQGPAVPPEAPRSIEPDDAGPDTLPMASPGSDDDGPRPGPARAASAPSPAIDPTAFSPPAAPRTATAAPPR